jgi:hypothetical protein
MKRRVRVLSLFVLFFYDKDSDRTHYPSSMIVVFETVANGFSILSSRNSHIQRTGSVRRQGGVKYDDDDDEESSDSEGAGAGSAATQATTAQQPRAGGFSVVPKKYNEEFVTSSSR